MMVKLLKYYRKYKEHGDQITNNSFNSSLNRLSEVDFAILVQNGKRLSSLFGVSFGTIANLKYKTVKHNIPEMIKSGQFVNLIQYLLKEKGKLVSLAKINAHNHNELLSFILWIKDELTAIYNLESSYLVSEPDMDMINAGVRELDELGDFVLIDGLVKEWCGAYTHEEIENMPYGFIFDKQLKSVKEARIQKRYNEIIKNKNKK